ncbi:TlpA family protein disulfide reductase [Chitinophaga horti]|uniref:TlpA family protein disulfide reductase n=1 Tax=Chitinophaga horti TaxID=2920382 RepID=A0ABY6IW00_9BACT|nr:TlpA family protein disulfide reductase [Chitinophaga horti]UYQ91553.1 TlpA family protein disulfide reductase [Chitinophaga horti]
MSKICLITTTLLLCTCMAFSQRPIPSLKIDELEKLVQSGDTSYVLNLWATWCAPCIQEIPDFERQARELKDKPVKFIFVSLDMSDAYPRDIAAFAKRRRIRSSIVWLNEPNANSFAARIDPRWKGSIPCTIFINPKKGYRKFVEGQITKEELKKEVDALL